MDIYSGQTQTVRAKLSTDLAEVDSEIHLIDAELNNLKARRKILLEKRSEIQKRISNNDRVLGEPGDQWNKVFPWSNMAETVLKETFKLTKFRPLQEATINALMSGEDTIVIMSTGGGKSLCYQLPAVLMEGLTLVVSPLISLIEDQLVQLKKLGISAATLNQSTSKEMVKYIECAITRKDSDFRLLYVTPEKLAKSKRIMNKLEKSVEVGFLKLIAVDEVHCCSQWGHDFRTDYKFLNILKRQFRNVPILGLTATATHHVLIDVKDMLGIPAAVVFRTGFNRSNLYYEVKMKQSGNLVEEIAHHIKSRFGNSSGIIYCFSRKDCEDVAKKLRGYNIPAAHYHAYLEPDERSEVHEKWLADKYQIIVATVAFGMGIDKANVRFVIHYALPKSIDSYYQESGRAGRDGQPATCILYYRLSDMFRQSTMVCTEKTGIQNLYTMVRYAMENAQCRRAILAEHFEEKWEPDWCQKSCDVCEKKLKTTVVNIVDYAQFAVAKIEEEAQCKKKESSGRVTGGKLVDLLVRNYNCNMDFIESVVCNLLLDGYLQEDFHFTPYSIISYITSGPKWKLFKGDSILAKIVPIHEQRQTSRKRKL